MQIVRWYLHFCCSVCGPEVYMLSHTLNVVLNFLWNIIFCAQCTVKEMQWRWLCFSELVDSCCRDNHIFCSDSESTQPIIFVGLIHTLTHLNLRANSLAAWQHAFERCFILCACMYRAHPCAIQLFLALVEHPLKHPTKVTVSQITTWHMCCISGGMIIIEESLNFEA
jgi:hypothetical protein